MLAPALARLEVVVVEIAAPDLPRLDLRIGPLNREVEVGAAVALVFMVFVVVVGEGVDALRRELAVVLHAAPLVARWAAEVGAQVHGGGRGEGVAGHCWWIGGWMSCGLC